jgi:hypothetical protein
MIVFVNDIPPYVVEDVKRLPFAPSLEGCGTTADYGHCF